MLWSSSIAIAFCSAMKSAPILAQTMFQVLCSWLIWLYLIAFGFPCALEVIEPNSTCLVSAICDFVQHARTVLSEITLANTRRNFLRNVIREVFAIFFANSSCHNCYSLGSVLCSLPLMHPWKCWIKDSGQFLHTPGTEKKSCIQLKPVRHLS